MKELILLGSGGHCKSVIDVIEQEKKYKIAGIIDNKKQVGDIILGYPVIGCDDNLKELYKTYKFAFIAVGQIKSPNIRIKLFKILKEIGYTLPAIISPRAYVSKYAKIDEGSVIMHDALINAGAKIGQNCIVNTKALVEHDAVIENNCHISTGAIVNGGTIVKENSFYGSNATSKEYIKVGGFIKAGSIAK